MQKELYDLTNPQKSIWLTEEFYKGTSIGNITGTIAIANRVNFNLLGKAINLFVQKNDSFRTKIIIDNGKVKQFFDDYEPFNVGTFLVSSEKDVKKLQKEIANTPFEILNSSLIFFKMFKFPDGHGGFFVNLHHLMSDAWTSGLGSSEIIELYIKLLKNEEISDKLEPSYIDYIKSEQEYLNSEKFKKDEIFWNEVFEKVPENATIPSTLKEKSVSSSSKRKDFTISKETVSLINEYCKSNKFSAFNFFMGIFAIYIYKVLNVNNFVIGTPILNRLNFKEKHTTGMFISTVPFKISIEDDNSFIDFASKISKDFFTIFKHQKYPYQYMLENLRKKDSSIPNLYNILISYQNTKTNTQESEVPFDTLWVPNNNISDDIDIHLCDMNDTGNIDIHYDYKIDKYSIDDIFCIHSRILHIVNQILENNSISIKNLEIVTPDEKNKILYKFNNTKADYPKDKTISQLFEEQVEKTPNNLAVVFEDKSLTYKELNEKSNSLAHYLRDNDISRNDIVGIMVNRSLEMIISILAVLKSGASYIPIDPEYPEDRISYMLDNSNAKLLLTMPKFENKVNFNNKVFVDLSSKIYNLNHSNLENINEPTDTSYIIYTSGSTGKPKGVVLNHKALANLANYCNNYVEYLKENSYRTIVSVTTVSFDIFIFETLISLQRGLKLVIASEEAQTIPRLLNDLIEKNNIEIIQTTPSRMQLLVNNLNEIPNLKKIKYTTLAGEQLPLSLVQAVKKITNGKVYNGYGPSETTVFSSLTDVTNHNQITIGKPLDNTGVYILDKNLNPMPIGTPGELYISGDGVGKGYLNNKELTSKSFINNPFIPNTLMYKTGDMGYFLENSEIICLGRSDNQVKIRGLRIELEEIEHKLLNIGNISTCVVVKKVSKDSHEFLCAYYTSTQKISIDNIRSLLKKELPNYMVPQYFVELDELPYTPNGKVDRKKLPEPEVTNNRKIVLPRNNIDIKLIELLKELINVNEISIEDSFLDLGGDSLTAINFCTRIYNEFNIQIFVKDVLDNPVVSSLSDFIATKNSDVLLATIPKAENSLSYPVSSAQKRTFYASQIAGDNSTLYNIAGSVILSSIPDVKKLQKCFNILIQRHEALRTYFEIENENVVQKIKSSVDFKLETESEPIDNKNIKSVFYDFVKPFDLSKAPLIRAKLVTLNDARDLLLVDMHHIISDGTSLGILVNEICKLYNDEVLPELNISYKDFACFENNKLKNNELKEAEDFWINQFKNEVPVLNIPLVYPRPAVQSFEGKKVYFSTNTSLKEKIENLSNSLGVTPYMLLLSCYYILLSKYSGQSDIVVGSPIMGRDLPELQGLIGMFVNSLPLRNSIDTNYSFKDFLTSVKENCLDCYKYQTYPFDELVSKLNLKRDTSRNPLFDTMFIYQNNGFAPINFNGINAEYYIPDSKISKFDLSLEVIPKDDSFEMSFEYCTKLFDNNFVQRLSSHYINIVNTIIENIDIKISDICMLSENEKNKILYDFNNTKTSYPKDKTISQLFEEQVEKTPDNVAVVFEDKSLTYKELNEKSNSLAHYLRDNGISRNDIIGIMVNRSLEMIISILAVLKSGASYIPIDPNYPENRISYMLNNSNAKLLLTRKFLEETIFFENILCIDLENTEIYSFSTINLENINETTDTSYIIYTSGSTGKPKGVVLNHKALVNLSCYLNNKVEFLQSSCNSKIIASVTTVSFDIFIFETLICMQKGLTIVLANEEEQHIPSKLNSLIEKNNVEIIQMTPSRIQLFLDNKEDFKAINKLKYIVLAGEPLPDKLLAELLSFGVEKVYNGYGPSETTVFSTFTDVTSYSKINIGKPLANTYAYILDTNLNLLPIGIPGELYISGDGVGKGYLNNKELTSKSFINNPFLPNTLMYKTGDFCKFLNNGEISYLERVDNQVKIRGLRIELEEIENQILKYPNVKKVKVIKQIIENREFISAYFVADKKIRISSLRKNLSEALPNYMVPSYFTAMDAFPYTPNGKIDKKALPIPSEILNTEKEKYVAPKSELEIKIVSILENLLHTKPIGLNDNFFELGGDSVLAMNLSIELLKISNKITYADIFKFPTALGLVKKIEATQNEKEYNNFELLKDKYSSVLEKIMLPSKPKQINLGNVLLTGVTGFLGTHILNSLLKYEKCKIYCIIRNEPGITAQTKLFQKLNFYFGNKYDKLIGERIIAITGDITQPGFGLNQDSLIDLANSINIIINSAAKVDHYGTYSDFYNTNTKSVKYMLDFCKSFNKKFYQISTLSISGNSFDTSSSKQNLKEETYFKENNLYIGQNLDNVYIRSKFEAECMVLNSINNGVDAYILRMGNLMPRFKDGIFQENILDNAYINRIVAFVKLGFIPDYIQNGYLEFTPIDVASNAIVKIITHPTTNNRIFHLFNHNHVFFKQCFNILIKNNLNIEVISEIEFKKKIKAIINSKRKKEILNSLVNDLDGDLHLLYKTDIIIKSDFTINFLNKIGFKWPKINKLYLNKFIEILKRVI